MKNIPARTHLSEMGNILARIICILPQNSVFIDLEQRRIRSLQSRSTMFLLAGGSPANMTLFSSTELRGEGY